MTLSAIGKPPFYRSCPKDPKPLPVAFVSDIVVILGADGLARYEVRRCKPPYLAGKAACKPLGDSCFRSTRRSPQGLCHASSSCPSWRRRAFWFKIIHTSCECRAWHARLADVSIRGPREKAPVPLANLQLGPARGVLLIPPFILPRRQVLSTSTYLATKAAALTLNPSRVSPGRLACSPGENHQCL